jgi:hypothetical protein
MELSATPAGDPAAPSTGVCDDLTEISASTPARDISVSQLWLAEAKRSALGPRAEQSDG